MKYIGIALIILQIVSYIGNISAGAVVLPSLTPNGIAFFIGQNVFLIIGVVLIYMDVKAKKCDKSKSGDEKTSSQEKSFYDMLDDVDRDSSKK